MFFDVTLTKIKILLTLKICFIHRNRSCYLGSEFFGVGIALKQHSLLCFEAEMKEKVKFWGEINFCFVLLFSFSFHHIFSVEGGQTNKNQPNISPKMKNFLPISSQPDNLAIKSSTCSHNEMIFSWNREWRVGSTSSNKNTSHWPLFNYFDYKDIRKHEYTRRLPIEIPG